MPNEPVEESKSLSENQGQKTLSPIAQAFKLKLEDYCTGTPSAYVGGKTRKDDAPDAGNLFQYWIRKAVGTEQSESSRGIFTSPFKNTLGFLSRSPKKEEPSGASLSRIFDAMELLPESEAQFDLVEHDTDPKTRLPKLILEICSLILNENMTDLSPWMIDMLEKGENGAYERLLKYLEPANQELSVTEKRSQAKQRLANEFIGAAIAFCPQKLTDIYQVKKTEANQDQILQYEYEDICAVRDAYANRTTTAQTLIESLQSKTETSEEVTLYHEMCLEGSILLKHYDLIAPNNTLSDSIRRKLNVLIDKYQEIEVAQEHHLSPDTRMREFLDIWASSNIEIELKIIAQRVLECYKEKLPTFDSLILSKKGDFHGMQIDQKALHKQLVMHQQNLIEMSEENTIKMASKLSKDRYILVLELYQLLEDVQYLSDEVPKMDSDKINSSFIQDKLSIQKKEILNLTEELLDPNNTMQLESIKKFEQLMHSSSAVIARNYRQNNQQSKINDKLVNLSNSNKTLLALFTLKQHLVAQNTEHVLLSEIMHRIEYLKTREELPSDDMQELEKTDLIYQLAFSYLKLSTLAHSISKKISSSEEKRLHDEYARLIIICTNRIQEHLNVKEAQQSLDCLTQGIHNPKIIEIINQTKLELNKGPESSCVKDLIVQIKELDATYREILEEDLRKGKVSSPLIESIEDTIQEEILPLLPARKSPTTTTATTSSQENKLPLWNLERLRQQASSFVSAKSGSSSPESERTEPRDKKNNTM